MKKKIRVKPTPSELEILHILWSRGPSTVREIHDVLAKEKDVGYTSALKLLHSKSNGTIDLLFSDVVLPGGMNGQQLAERAVELHPDLKVLFATGYARDAIVHDGRVDAGLQLITKPFILNELAARLRAVIEADARRAH